MGGLLPTRPLIRTLPRYTLDYKFQRACSAWIAKARARLSRSRGRLHLHFMKTLPVVWITLIVASLAACGARPNQTLSKNKAVVLRSEAELWSEGNLAAADELYGPDFICHFIGGTEWKGIQGLKSEVASHRAAFPDWNEKVDDIIAEGDRVVIRFTSSGTQRGEFAGMAPHGEKVTIHEAAIYRVVAGKIVEQWGFPDSQSLMQQLMAPAPGKQ